MYTVRIECTTWPVDEFFANTFHKNDIDSNNVMSSKLKDIRARLISFILYSLLIIGFENSTLNSPWGQLQNVLMDFILDNCVCNRILLVVRE